MTSSPALTTIKILRGSTKIFSDNLHYKIFDYCRYSQSRWILRNFWQGRPLPMAAPSDSTFWLYPFCDFCMKFRTVPLAGLLSGPRQWWSRWDRDCCCRAASPPSRDTCCPCSGWRASSDPSGTRRWSPSSPAGRWGSSWGWTPRPPLTSCLWSSD